MNLRVRGPFSLRGWRASGVDVRRMWAGAVGGRARTTAASAGYACSAHPADAGGCPFVGPCPIGAAWNARSVEAHKNPECLRQTANAVETFREALVRFLAFHVVNEHLARGIAPAVFRRDDVDDAEIDAATHDVDLAAGRAGAAPGLTGCMIAVQGAGVIDPIAAWHTITKPKPLLEPDDILSACGQMIGRLEQLVLKAEAEAPPRVGAEAMHPLVWGAAQRLWRDHHFRHAVAAAAEALIAQVKSRTERNDVPETALWQETFSERDPVPGKPRLRWPGDPADRAVKNMNDGLRLFAAGVQMTIRNTATHPAADLSEQEALERLATLSLLARWLDECELVGPAGE